LVSGGFVRENVSHEQVDLLVLRRLPEDVPVTRLRDPRAAASACSFIVSSSPWS
jgi:hypothetical protein